MWGNSEVALLFYVCLFGVCVCTVCCGMACGDQGSLQESVFSFHHWVLRLTLRARFGGRPLYPSCWSIGEMFHHSLQLNDSKHRNTMFTVVELFFFLVFRDLVSLYSPVSKKRKNKKQKTKKTPELYQKVFLVIDVSKRKKGHKVNIGIPPS